MKKMVAVDLIFIVVYGIAKTMMSRISSSKTLSFLSNLDTYKYPQKFGMKMIMSSRTKTS
jgi:hypothetical protein